MREVGEADLTGTTRPRSRPPRSALSETLSLVTISRPRSSSRQARSLRFLASFLRPRTGSGRSHAGLSRTSLLGLLNRSRPSSMRKLDRRPERKKRSQLTVPQQHHPPTHQHPLARRLQVQKRSLLGHLERDFGRTPRTQPNPLPRLPGLYQADVRLVAVDG
jgi:hypothetical protein